MGNQEGEVRPGSALEGVMWMPQSSAAQLPDGTICTPREQLQAIFDGEFDGYPAPAEPAAPPPSRRQRVQPTE